MDGGQGATAADTGTRPVADRFSRWVIIEKERGGGFLVCPGPVFFWTQAYLSRHPVKVSLPLSRDVSHSPSGAI
jgi:hypothetical protein